MKQEKILTTIFSKSLKKRGFFKSIFVGIKLFSEYFYYKAFKSQGRFKLDNTSLGYFYYPYNATWRNERVVEIPVIINVLSKNKKILEFGNVLSHYFSVNYDILDKYEKAKGIINKDIIKFKPNKKYDLIISISTLEHVGWDGMKDQKIKIKY